MTIPEPKRLYDPDAAPPLARCDRCHTAPVLVLAWEGPKPIMALACDCRMAATEGFSVESLPNRWK